MKVLDLECTRHHVFEGWFGSEDEFQGQLARGLVECPICGDSKIVKRLSAPRINLGARTPREETLQAETRQDVISTRDPVVQAQWMKMVREVLENTEDVGERFAEEARRIHYGEAEERNIRGQASAAETEELIDEGIGVLPLPMPHGMKGPLQ